LVFFGFDVFATLVLQMIDGSLQTAAAPQGIVSYELAGNAIETGRILDSWDANARLHAAFSLGFDYLYMLAYTVTLALAALWLADARKDWIRSAGLVVAWGMGVAGLADALENYFLWQMLVSGPAETPAMMARWAALLKFALIILAVLYIIFVLIAHRFLRK